MFPKHPKDNIDPKIKHYKLTFTIEEEKAIFLAM